MFRQYPNCYRAWLRFSGLQRAESSLWAGVADEVRARSCITEIFPKVVAVELVAIMASFVMSPRSKIARATVSLGTGPIRHVAHLVTELVS